MARSRVDKTQINFVTSDVPEGTNLYYTTARANADFDTRFATKTTTNIPEGTNLYYTDSRADARIALQKGAANGIATLGADSKIPSSQLPALAITDTFVVGSQVAMLALAAETGDVAVRTDLNKTYILRGTDPTVLGDWQELLTPTDSVLSVNGFTGSVVLTTSDIAEGTNLYYTDARFDTRLATKTTTNLAEGTNLYYTQARFDSAFAAKSTTNLAEGTNLYYTDARVRNAISATAPINFDSGTGIISLSTVPIAKGGTNNTSFILGSIVFYDGTKLAEDNANFFWDNINLRLGLKTAVPVTTLDNHGSTSFTGLTVTQITSDTANWALGSSTFFRVSSDASRNVSGISQTANGKTVILVNVGSNVIVLQHENAASTAANRFSFSGGVNLTLPVNGRIVLIYDNTTARWRDIESSSCYAVMQSPAQIAANTNNYNPFPGKVFRLTSDVNNRQLTGLLAGIDGQIATFINVNASNFNIVIVDESASSTAANRFANSSGANINLGQFGSMTFIYDGASSRWRDITFR